ncbi:hypothetical protein D3C72_714840 [compost metagenome]
MQGEIHLTHLFAGTGQHGARHQGGDLAAGGQGGIGQALMVQWPGEAGHYAPGHGLELGPVTFGQVLLELGGRLAEMEACGRGRGKGPGLPGQPLQLAAALANAPALIKFQLAHPEAEGAVGRMQYGDPLDHQGVAPLAHQPERGQIPQLAVGVAADNQAEFGEAGRQLLVLLQPKVAEQYDVLYPFGLDLAKGGVEGLFDAVEAGVGIRACDGGHLRQGDAEQGEGDAVDDAPVPGAAGIKQLRQAVQSQRGIGRLLAAVEVGGQHRIVELAQKLHQRAVAEIELMVADHHGIRSQQAEQVGVGPPLEAVEIERPLEGVTPVQQQAGLARGGGLLAQGGQPGQDAAVAATLGAPLGLTLRGEAHGGAIEMGVAVTEVGKLNRNTQGSVLLREKEHRVYCKGWGGCQPGRRRAGKESDGTQAGTRIWVARITTSRPTATGIEVRLTTSNGERLPMPAQATTTPETGEMVRPRLEACSMGITR